MILPLPESMQASILELAIFTGILYWLCPSFVNAVLDRIVRMVDVLIDTSNWFSTNQSSQTGTLSTISNLKSLSRNQTYKKAISREADIKNRESNLFNIKDNVPELQMPRPKSVLPLACQNCTITSRESLINKTTERMALRNTFVRPKYNHNFISRYLSDVYYNYSIESFDIELAPDEKVLGDDRIKKAIERMSKEQLQDVKKELDDPLYRKLMENNSKRAKTLFDNMKSALSDYVLRCANWFFHKMFPLFLNSVLVHPGQINMIKEASKSGLPLIFLPLHRSHLDYLLLTYILFNNKIKCPLVAAGDNLRLPFFGQVLRGLGAFYIKRRIDPIEGHRDHIYKAVLHTYMNHSLRNGNNIEFYIEGGRTRTGKPLMPKYGVFSVIVDSLMDGTIDDALLIPVSMNYDKLVDGNFTREQLGESKKMETVFDTVKSLWKSINGDYGMVKVDFNQPCSLRELVKSFKLDDTIETKKKLCSANSVSSIYGTEVVECTNKNVIENISRHIVFDACQSMSVMATNAVAFILLNKFRDGAPIEEIANALDILRQDLDYSQKELSFQGNSVDVINYAVEMLGPELVKKEKINGQKIIKPQVTLPSCIELSYYSNTLVPHYAIDSIIALAIKSLNSGIIDADNLMEAANELCNILQYEFIFCKPCQTVEQSIQYYLDDLIYRKQIFIMENENVLESKGRRIALQFIDEDDEDAYISVKYQLNDDPKVKEYLEFYREIVLPLLECYSVAAQTLVTIVGKTVLESEFIKLVLDNLRMQLTNKAVLHGEALSTDTVKNALKLFVSWGVLDFHNEGKVRLYYFKKGKDNEKEANDLYKRINKYRPVTM